MRGCEHDPEVCSLCIESTPCCICKRLDPNEDGILCDKCGLDGMTCMPCTGVKNVPEGKWFCNKCRRETKSPYCSFLYTSTKPLNQFVMACATCNITMCLVCAKTCHETHVVHKIQRYGRYVCECMCIETNIIQELRKSKQELTDKKREMVRELRETKTTSDNMIKNVFALETEIERLKEKLINKLL